MLFISSNYLLMDDISEMYTIVDLKTFYTKSNKYWNIKSKNKINNNQPIAIGKISSKIETYLFELKILSHKNSYFAKPQISIKDVAHASNIPVRDLKNVFKYHSKLSFSD